MTEVPPLARVQSAPSLGRQRVRWIGAYLAVVLGPVALLLVGETPPGRGYWWDFAVAIGFAATTMLGVQFALTARFRRATSPFGIDWVYYLHRYLAILATALVLGHVVVLVVVEPALLDLLRPSMGMTYLTSGAASVVALLLLVGLSLGRKRLHLAYERWRWTHGLLALLVLAFAITHIWQAQYYVAVPWKRTMWVAIVAAWIGILLYVRLVKPWSLVRRPYVVRELRAERGDAWTMVVAPVGHGGLAYQAGQFAWVSIGRSPWSMTEHPFSISSAPSTDGALSFTIKELGDFTATIGATPIGERVFVDGPHGAFSTERYPAPGYVMVAGGIGIAPIMSMLRDLAAKGDPRPVTLFYAYRLWDRLTFREEIEQLKSHLALTVVYVLTEPPEEWSGERGLLSTDILDRQLPADRAQLQYFICGPVPMIELVEGALEQLGIDPKRVHSELFDLV